MNKMVIQDETPLYAASETQYTILRYAAMAAKWKGTFYIYMMSYNSSGDELCIDITGRELNC